MKTVLCTPRASASGRQQVQPRELGYIMPDGLAVEYSSVPASSFPFYLLQFQLLILFHLFLPFTSLIMMVMMFFAAASVLFSLVSSVVAVPANAMPVPVTVTYDQTYDTNGESLDAVACSNGPNGLESKG